MIVNLKKFYYQKLTKIIVLYLQNVIYLSTTGSIMTKLKASVLNVILDIMLALPILKYHPIEHIMREKQLPTL